MKVRQKEEKSYKNMKYQMGQVKRNYVKMNESKSRIIEDQKRKKYRLRGRSSETAKAHRG
eukprot:TRINITY_DN177_c0_g2_i5.p4 TRINITY_DN177_c0_g2~~TRINITY_DN177_c0_g2_i5.p4  ORF type:complete len:60 (+),score=35.13 TRINITY_DN177_c0_g2_i5:833-1012(+)